MRIFVQLFFFQNIENEKDSCSYEAYPNSRLIYADIEYRNVTKSECQERCSLEKRFFCQGVSYYDPRHNLANAKCLIHSEDVISLGPRSLLYENNFIYLRRTKCLNGNGNMNHWLSIT